MSNNPERISELLRVARRVTVLTGAGISTESGIPDFKSMDQSWDYERPREEMLSASFWQRSPRRFWEVYRSTLRSTSDSPEIAPGSFHRWLVELESLPRTASVDILTQNVDGLHSKAGSSSVIEAHGNSSRAICLECRGTVPMDSLDGDPLPLCPSSSCEFSVLKPDISLFSEGVNSIGEFRRAIDRCGLLIVAGTSLNVGPVNGFPAYAQMILRPTLWISDEEPPEGYYFTEKWIGSAKDFVQTFQF